MRARRADPVPRGFLRPRPGRAAARGGRERQRQDEPAAYPLRPRPAERRRSALEGAADREPQGGLCPRAGLHRARACGEGRSHPAREPRDRLPAQRPAGEERGGGRGAGSGALAEAPARRRVPALPVRKLSQGQRRRAALARLLVSEAPLWLLDEPFATLDAQGISLLNDLLEKQVEGGGAVVYTTHQEAGIRSTRVVDLGRGA